MSLATRCTSCGTIFRVVQDQLKVSEGWVRCGRCQEVFNALEGLFDLEREAPPQRKLSATQMVAQGMAEFVASHPPRPGEDSLHPFPATDEGDAIESRFLASPSGSGGLEPPPADRGGRGEHADFADARFPSELPLDAADEAPMPPIDLGLEQPAPAPGPAVPLLQRWRDKRAARHAAAASSLLEPTLGEAPAAGRTVEPAPAPLPPGAPGFLRQAEAEARWQRPRVRFSLVVLGTLLLGVLLTQVAMQFRDAFATQWPESRPTLETLCELLDCRIEPLRRLSAVTVEASGLTQVEGSEAYRLSVTLHNRSAVPIALPSVELSLTDASGALISRRALAPGDFRALPGQAAPAAVLAASSEAQLQALLSARGARISGYTVELFYP